jgi:hypothetical protein
MWELCTYTLNPISHWLGPFGRCLLWRKKYVFLHKCLKTFRFPFKNTCFFLFCYEIPSKLYLEVRFKRAYAAISVHVPNFKTWVKWLQHRSTEPILPLNHCLQQMLLKKMQRKAYFSKNQILILCFILKPKRTKIFAFNDFQVLFNSAHFLMTQIDQFFKVYLYCPYHKEFRYVTLSSTVPEI